MEKILSAEEWMNYKYKNANANIRSAMDMQEYAKYLLEKQAEYIAERVYVKNQLNKIITDRSITDASNEFIKNIEL